MIDWITAPVTLPRWVVWGALLTTPALWSKRFGEIVRRRMPGDRTAD